MKNISSLFSKRISPLSRKYHNPVSFARHSMILSVFFMLLSPNLKADLKTEGGSWTSPNWSTFSISGASACNTTTLTVGWNQWSFFCCGGCSNTLQYKATIELQYSANGINGWTTVQTIVKNGFPFSQTFTVATTGYYIAWVFPEAKVLTGPCSPTGWQGTGQSSATPIINITVTKPAIANGSIKNGPTCGSSAVVVYTTEPQILLTNTSTNNPTQYKIDIVKMTANCGGILTGGGAFANTTDWLNGNPGSIDLKPLFSGYLGNAANAPNYYLITFSVQNGCLPSSSKTFCIYLNNISTASANFKFLDQNGVASITPGTLCTSSPSVCQISSAINGSTSTGTIDKYWLKIEQYTTGCVFTKVVVDGFNSATNICQLSDMAGLNLNVYVKNKWTSSGNTGTPPNTYFLPGTLGAPTSAQRYKITLTVSNPVGSVFKTGWFTNTNANCRLTTDSYEGAVSSSLKTHAYPNPCAENMTISFELSDRLPVTLFISDISGKRIKSVFEDQVFDEGIHLREVDTSSFPSGVYFYTIISKESVTGKFVKL